MSIAEPAKIITPWADTGSKNPIPQNSNNTTGAAGYDKGFPDITMTPPEAGGIPPAGQDFNGIFYEVTKILRYIQAGGRPTFSATLAAEIGGYPKGALVLSSDGIAIYTNRLESNSSNPNSGGSGWAREDLMLREALRRSYAEAGLNLIGDFSDTGLVVNPVTDVVLWEPTGVAYSYSGTLPYTIGAGETPIGNPLWVAKAGNSLRGELATPGGSELIYDVSGLVEVGSVPRFSDTAGVPTLLVPDDPTKRLFINKVCTSPDDFSVIQVARHANYTGGTAGFVGTAFQAKTHVEPTAIGTSEWAGLFQLDNHAPNNPAGGGPGSGSLPQNVAIYGQSQKRDTGSTWALCLEINDYRNPASGSAIGQEIACSGNGPDDVTFPQRNSSHAAIGQLVPGGQDLEWGRGYWVSTGPGARVRYAFDNTAAIGEAVLHNSGAASLASSSLIKDQGSLVTGIDLSAATYSSTFAFVMKTGHKFAFDTNKTLHMRGVGGVVACTGLFQFQNSIAFVGAGNISNTATTGATNVLPAKPEGFITIKIDGVNRKIPYYND